MIKYNSNSNVELIIIVSKPIIFFQFGIKIVHQNIFVKINISNHKKYENFTFHFNPYTKSETEVQPLFVYIFV